MVLLKLGFHTNKQELKKSKLRKLEVYLRSRVSYRPHSSSPKVVIEGTIKELRSKEGAVSSTI